MAQRKQQQDFELNEFVFSDESGLYSSSSARDKKTPWFYIEKHLHQLVGVITNLSNLNMVVSDL